MTLEIFFVSITFSVAGKSETVEMIRKKKKKKNIWILYVCMTFNLKRCITTLSQHWAGHQRKRANHCRYGKSDKSTLSVFFFVISELNSVTAIFFFTLNLHIQFNTDMKGWHVSWHVCTSCTSIWYIKLYMFSIYCQIYYLSPFFINCKTYTH